MTERVVDGSGDRRGTLTPAEDVALRSLALHGSLAAAALIRGVAYGTEKDQVWKVCAKLGVATAIDAFRVRGWLVIPT